MHILYYVNDKFLRLIVNNDNKHLSVDFMEKTDKKRKDYYLDDCDDWLDDCLEYEENVLYLMAYSDDDRYIYYTIW